MTRGPDNSYTNRLWSVNANWKSCLSLSVSPVSNFCYVFCIYYGLAGHGNSQSFQQNYNFSESSQRSIYFLIRIETCNRVQHNRNCHFVSPLDSKLFIWHFRQCWRYQLPLTLTLWQGFELQLDFKFEAFVRRALVNCVAYRSENCTSAFHCAWQHETKSSVDFCSPQRNPPTPNLPLGCNLSIVHRIPFNGGVYNLFTYLLHLPVHIS
jgi:hypothetical protein